MILGMFFKLFLWLLFESTTAEFSEGKLGCDTKCGNITIPYPFGIGVECAQKRGLYITCNHAYTPARPYIMGSNLEIVEVSLTEVLVKNWVSFRCYNTSGYVYGSNEDMYIDLESSPYTFSDKRNRFMSVGCNIIGFIQGREQKKYTSGCVSMCTSNNSVIDGSCSGIGCCQTSIPKGLKYFTSYIRRPYDDWNPETLSYNPCSYVFLADQHKFKFHASDISDSSFFNNTLDVPVVLDWVIENITCMDAKRNISSYACMENTDCVESDNGPGYRCSCSKGYKGNPYLAPGCQDINECLDPKQNECLGMSNCVNLLGSYKCTCPQQANGDGKKIGIGIGCIPKSKPFPVTAVILAYPGMLPRHATFGMPFMPCQEP